MPSAVKDFCLNLTFLDHRKSNICIFIYLSINTPRSLNNKHLDRVKPFVHQTGPGLMTWVPELVVSCWGPPVRGADGSPGAQLGPELIHSREALMAGVTLGHQGWSPRGPQVLQVQGSILFFLDSAKLDSDHSPLKKRNLAKRKPPQQLGCSVHLISAWKEERKTAWLVNTGCH